MKTQKKELDGLVGKAKEGAQANKEKLLSEDARKALETEKVEEAKKAEDAKKASEAQAIKDKELLAKKESELNAEEKKRKEDIQKAEEIKRKAEEDNLPTDAKIKRIQEQTQKRIDEVIAELKVTKDKSEKEVTVLRDELTTLKKEKTELETKLNPPKDEELIIAEVEKAYADVQYKYLEEDKDKPIEQRREMTQEEWDEWHNTDPKAATAWETRQEMRRVDEKKREITKKSIEKRTKVFLDEVAESAKRTLKKHPELDISKREKELEAEGKTKDEIKEITLSENPKAKLCYEIIQEHPEFIQRANGPELVVAEMERRLANKDSKSAKDLDNEALLKRIDALEEKLADAEARANLDEGISSVRHEEGKEIKLTEGEQNLVDTMTSKGASQKMIDSALEKYRKQGKK